MRNVYAYALQSVRNGARYKVDFEKRSLKVGRKYLILNGEYKGELGVFCYERDIIPWLERKYQTYKHSVPCEASDKQRKRYFAALKERDLSDDDMLYGERRECAQCDLEVLLLCLIVGGLLVWNDDKMGKWFWQSEKDKDFVILKKWITSNNK